MFHSSLPFNTSQTQTIVLTGSNTEITTINRKARPDSLPHHKMILGTDAF